jgi:hypothetical protein
MGFWVGVVLAVRLICGFAGVFYGFADGLMASRVAQFG